MAGSFLPAIYEPSCEAYKHLGQTSNYYWIDPDGSGPLGPLKVYCNMTEDKVWTIVSHDLQMQTTVVGYNPEKYSVTQLVYSASMDQISAITSSAEYCEQYISYFCKMSRLLNTPVYSFHLTPFSFEWRASSSCKYLLSDQRVIRRGKRFGSPAFGFLCYSRVRVSFPYCSSLPSSL
ncbi:hypothetical protein CB1_001748007 [Camelus ferus]|nr:hypothetical protein CB1_001748007 [Camelus ferus]